MNDCAIMLSRRAKLVARLVLSVSLVVGSAAAAAEDIRVNTVLSNLRGPAAVAIRQTPGVEAYEIFVAEVGAGRVLRIRSDKTSDSQEAITGFIASTDDDDLLRLPGPHALLFLDANRLVVAGSDGDSRPFVRIYELTDQAKPLTAEQPEHQAETAADEEKPYDNIAGFYSVARTLSNDKVSDFLVLGAITNDHRTTTWKIPVRSGTLGDLSPLGKDQSGDAPLALTVEPRGYIVFIRPDKAHDSPASRMEFVNPIDGLVAVTLPIELATIVGVAYSPRTGKLYVIKDSSQGTNRSGVYRIDMDESSKAGELSATAAFVAEVERPTALAFGRDGSLYVTSLGKDGQNGSLQKISGGL